MNDGSTLVDLNLDPPFPNAPAFRATTLAADPGFVSRFRRDSVHFAAGLTICEAAGCKVTDLQGEKWGSGAMGLLVAADATTHDALLSLVRKCL